MLKRVKALENSDIDHGTKKVIKTVKGLFSLLDRYEDDWVDDTSKCTIHFEPTKSTYHWCHLNMNREKLIDLSESTPVSIGNEGNRRYYWLFKRVIYWESERLSADDVKALVLAREKKKSKTIARAKTAISTPDADSFVRETITDELRIKVWQRDGGKCVKCGSNRDLEFDHIIPVSMGGATSFRNLQLLCQDCNREKGGNLC